MSDDDSEQMKTEFDPRSKYIVVRTSRTQDLWYLGLQIAAASIGLCETLVVKGLGESLTSAFFLFATAKICDIASRTLPTSLWSI